MPEKVILYRRDGACSMVPHIVLRHLSIPHTSVLLAPTASRYAAADGSFSADDYVRNVHPSGYVPALFVDGEVVTENPAILRYLASLAPQSGLLGKGLMQQAKAEEWLCWLSGSLHSAGFGALWRPARFTDDVAAHAGVMAKGRERILECYGRVEDRIVGPWVVGEEMTVVDVYLHTFWRWGVGVGFEMGRYQRFAEVMRRVEGVGSVRVVMEEEGQELTFGNGSLRGS